jgi:hypothetical protein
MREQNDIHRARGDRRGRRPDGPVRTAPAGGVRGPDGQFRALLRAADRHQAAAWGVGRPEWARSRRRPSGPRPVRPGVAPVAVRPARLERPPVTAGPVSSGQRLLVRRRPVRSGVALRVRLRRVLAGVAVGGAAAAVVVVLGLLASATAESRSSRPAFRDAEPVAERIVTDTSLTSVPQTPGQVRSVTHS